MLILRREYGRRGFHVAAGPSDRPDLLRFRLARGPRGEPVLECAGPRSFLVAHHGPARVEVRHGGKSLAIEARPDGATQCQVHFDGPAHFRIDRGADRPRPARGRKEPT